MKHTNLIPRILLAALTMLLMSNPLSSRAQVPVMSQKATLNFLARTNIVRQWRSYYVTYSYPKPSITITRISLSASFSMTNYLPDNTTVSDMQIANDTLFILGDEADTCGFVAYADLNDLVAGSPVFTVTRFPMSQYQQYQGNHYYRKFCQMGKLAVISDSPAAVAFTCQACDRIKLRDGSVRYDTTSCLAYYDFQSTDIEFLWDTLVEENFIDVFYTGKILVSLSEVPSQNATYARLFLNNPLDLSSVYKDYATSISDGYSVTSRMMGEPVGPYECAVAFTGTEMHTSNTGVWVRDMMIGVNTLNPSALNLTDNNSFMYYMARPLDFKAFVYNQYSHLYCLLMSINGNDQIIEYLSGNAPIRLTNFGCTMESIHTNDNCNYGAFVGVGQTSGSEPDLFLERNPLASQCLAPNNSAITTGRQLKMADIHAPLAWETNKYIPTSWRCSSDKTPSSILCAH